MTATTQRYVALPDLEAVHDTETDLYAPFDFVLIALFFGDTPTDVENYFNYNPERVTSMEYVSREELDRLNASADA
jgi:hypothetical protein